MGQAADSSYKHCTNRAITPGYGHARVPVLVDHTLALPESFDDIDTSKVRCIVSMEHAASVLRRYEGVIRREMASSSEVDQFFDIPESESAFFESFANLLIEPSRTIRGVLFGWKLVL